MLLFQPGVYTTEPFVHEYWEEVYLVDGDLTVGNDAEGNGGESFPPGTYACRPPGAVHGPVKSNRGCLLLEIHNSAGEGARPPVQRLKFFRERPSLSPLPPR